MEYLALIFGIISIILLVLLLTRKNNSNSSEIYTLLQKQNELLQAQLNESNKSIREQFAISQSSISQSQKQTSQIIQNVTEKLTLVEHTNKQVVDFAKQLESLEKILKNPKQRGILGEYYLETTLKNVLPPETYQMQYAFKSGGIVDAVVFIKDKIVPIDSKFSLEKYNQLIEEQNSTRKAEIEKAFIKDLKFRIEETSKYIRPNENTLEFAFMFIPSEGIYYDLLINKIGSNDSTARDLLTYAFMEKKVIIVSPTSFLAYLQTVLQGLKALQIEESAQIIRKNVIKLGRHLKTYEEHFTKVGKHLETSINFYDKAQKEFGKVEKDIGMITHEDA